MLNMITLLNWPEPEADQSFMWKNQVIVYKIDYYDTGIEAVNSLRPWDTTDLTWLGRENCG